MLRRNDKDMSPIRLYIFATIYCFATIKVVLTGSVVAATRLPTVTTSSGDVFGSLLPRNKDDDLQSEVAQYLGIPFAKPTKRWEPPQDFFAQPYVSDPLNATMWGRACLQVLSETSTYGSEDCLSANVWTPAIDGNEDGNESLLPVLVFIYGGSDQFGEAEPYNMSALAAYHQVVAVNFNYRTGPIGWMSFQEDVEANRSTGNFGILDIQSALRWVQREIVHFGGDKSRVAIHGQSSGGGLVELQYVSPQSNNLFQAAISESGGLHAESLASALDVSREAAKLTGCANASSPKTCMQALPGLNITSLTYQLGWGPVVDGVTIPYDPMEMLEDGAINPSSVVFGAQTNDSFLFLSEDYTKDGLPQPNSYPDGHLRAISKTEYEIALSKSVPSALVSAALTLYPPSADARSIVNVHMLGAVESDDMHCALRRRAAHFDRAQPDKNTSFVYRFDYYYKSSPTCSAVPNFHRDYLGSVHQDEVTFVLGQPNFMEDGSCCGKWGLSEGEESCAKLDECVHCYNESFGSGYRAYFDEAEFALSRTVGNFWANMARHAAPNGPSVPFWPSARDGGIVLNAKFENGGVKTERELYGDARFCEFWDSVASARRSLENS